MRQNNKNMVNSHLNWQPWLIYIRNWVMMTENLKVSYYSYQQFLPIPTKNPWLWQSWFKGRFVLHILIIVSEHIAIYHFIASPGLAINITKLPHAKSLFKYSEKYRSWPQLVLALVSTIFSVSGIFAWPRNADGHNKMNTSTGFKLI